jgi:Peptidase family S41
LEIHFVNLTDRDVMSKKASQNKVKKLKHQDNEEQASQTDARSTDQTMDLPTFLKMVGTLSLADRQLIVRQALVLIEQCYVHLPLKEKMHAIRPLQRLKLLQYQLAQSTEQQLPSEHQFHNEMTSIFNSARDLHTNYFLPDPFATHTAFLPFLVEEYFESEQPKYLVSKVTDTLNHPTFQPGVELTYWNGVPIAQAVLLNADRQAGSNLEARRARGIEALTIRSLFVSLPPYEEWVTVGYTTSDGTHLESRFDWRISSFFNPDWRSGDIEQSAAQGIDLQTRKVQQVKKQLFLPEIAAAERRLAALEAQPNAAEGLETNLPGVLRAQVIEQGNKSYGYLRIYTFDIDPEPFLEEVIRLLDQMPQNGLVIDVRGNGGGIIWSGERLLQLFTPRSIEPERLEFINSPLTLELCRQTSWLSEWTESINQSVTTGAVYSNGFPITPVADCNAIGQKYQAPVVLITDALCYSTTDIFAAGFQDHQIGPILGVSGNTGAGGANVWDQDLLRQLLEGSSSSPFESLERLGGMRVSIRRTLRVGDRQGVPVEDLGVVPDVRHYMTKDDLLQGNVDLISNAIRMMEDLPLYRLKLESHSLVEDKLKIKVRTQNLSRVDIYLDDRPQRSVDVKGGTTSISLKQSPVSTIELRGFSSGQLVAVDRIQLNESTM